MFIFLFLSSLVWEGSRYCKFGKTCHPKLIELLLKICVYLFYRSYIRLHSLQNRLKLVQINFIFSDNVHILYLYSHCVLRQLWK